MLTLALLLGACATPNEAKVETKPVVDTAAQAEAAAKLEAAFRLPGEEVLDAQPVIPALSAFEAPVPKETVLKNGLRVLVVEKAGAPIEALVLVVKRGSTSDPKGKQGLASLTAAMLEAGSAKKTQAEIASQADALGAELHALASYEGLNISISSLPTKLEPMAKLLADVALKPNFEPKEWKKVQEQRVAQLKERLADPRAAAANAFASALYGDGPLGHTVLGTPATVGALKLEDAKKFWAELAPGDAALIAVGTSPQKEVVELANKLFGAWKGTAKGAPVAAAGSAARPRLVLVEFPGRPQTVIEVGQPGVPFSSPDTIALRVMNSVLGGSFTSRLNVNLREKNGYSYGAASNFAFGREAGPFVAMSNVKTQVTGLALKEMLSELNKIVDEPLTEAEVAKGKSLLAYNLVESLQRSELTAALIGELVITGMPVDYLKQVVPRLQALTAAEVQAAAKRALDPKTMTITVVGDPGVVGQFEAAGLQLPAPEKRAPTGGTP
jgi:zinc protease